MLRSPLAVALASASIALCSPAALGQQSGGGSGRPAQATMTSGGMDIDFDGGTVREFVAHLEELTGERSVVIKNELAANATLPAIRLSDISFITAMSAIEALADGDDIRGIRASNIGGAFIIRADADRPIPAGATGSDFTFDGGSGLELLQKVKEVFPRANVVARGPARQANIPPLNLRNVNVYGVMNAIDGLVDDSRTDSAFRLDVEDKGMMFVIDARNISGPRSQVEFKAISLAGIVGAGRLSDADALSAIEAAVEVGGEADSTRIRFHEQTALLIVSGPQSVINAITQVVATLRESAIASQDALEQRAQLEREATIARSRMEYHRELYTYAESALERATAAFEAGDYSEHEVLEYRLELLDARASLQEAEARLKHLESVLQRYD